MEHDAATVRRERAFWRPLGALALVAMVMLAVVAGGPLSGAGQAVETAVSEVQATIAAPPADADLDGVADAVDNCLVLPNPDQLDADVDGMGDRCDPTPAGPDSDGDGVPDVVDNCPLAANADQADGDGDGIGDACAPVPTATPEPTIGPSATAIPSLATAPPTVPAVEPSPTPAFTPPPTPIPTLIPTPTLAPLVSGVAVAAPGDGLVSVEVPVLVAKIDAGRRDGIAVDGWTADADFVAGRAQTATPRYDVLGTAEDELYLSQRRARRGPFRYDIAVPKPDTYTVRVHLAELEFDRASARVFDVNAERGEAELKQIDIFEEAGVGTALVEELEIEVTDGELNLVFKGWVGRPTVAAIEVVGTPDRIGVPGANGGGLLAPGSGIAIANGVTEIRAAANPAEPAVARLTNGAAVLLTGIDAGGFYYVNYGSGLGWVPIGALSLPAYPVARAWTVAEMEKLIREAAKEYRQPAADMLRVAACESRMDPNAVNNAGSYGLMQFVATTWASTPYAEYSLFDPWASANAAAWMWSVGRRAEWVCQ